MDDQPGCEQPTALDAPPASASGRVRTTLAHRPFAPLDALPQRPLATISVPVELASKPDLADGFGLDSPPLTLLPIRRMRAATKSDSGQPLPMTPSEAAAAASASAAGDACGMEPVSSLRYVERAASSSDLMYMAAGGASAAASSAAGDAGPRIGGGGGSPPAADISCPPNAFPSLSGAPTVAPALGSAHAADDAAGGSPASARMPPPVVPWPPLGPAVAAAQAAAAAAAAAGGVTTEAAATPTAALGPSPAPSMAAGSGLLGGGGGAAGGRALWVLCIAFYRGIAIMGMSTCPDIWYWTIWYLVSDMPPCMLRPAAPCCCLQCNAIAPH